MDRRILVLSGPVGAGKSTLRKALKQRHGFRSLQTHELIMNLRPDVPNERAALQAAGDELDRTTGGLWVAQAVVRSISNHDDEEVVVDSCRIPPQVEALRVAYRHRVIHVHLTASSELLAQRYAERQHGVTELPSYADVRANKTEANIELMAEIADIVIDTERNRDTDVLVRVASRLGLYGRRDSLVDVLVGGQYGSEGKGHISSYLAPDYDVLVRVGGPNAGHRVFNEPEAETFYQLPSGTRRAPKSQIVLGPGAVLWLDGLRGEITKHEVEPGRLSIDPRAMIIEQSDRDIEAGKLKAVISSTAQGVGVATSRKTLRAEARPPVRLAGDVPEFKPYIRESAEVFEDAFRHGRRIFLEGTQGTALSVHHGDYPYVTSRDTSVSGCLADAGIAPSRVRRTIMVCRTYPIRVQNPPTPGATSGPMGREITWAEVARRSNIPLEELLGAERTTTTKRERRVGEFNWELLRRATTLNGPSDIALSFTDYLSVENRKARRFEQLTGETIRFIEEIERVTGAAVSLVATQFHFRGVIDRRAW